MMIEKFWYQRNILTFFLRPFSWLFRLLVFFSSFTVPTESKKIDAFSDSCGCSW